MSSNIYERLAELRENYNSMYDEALEIRTEVQRHLRRCPFCGNSPLLVVIVNDHGDFVPTVVCSNCNLSMEGTHVYPSVLEAMLDIDNVSNKWNNGFVSDEEVK